MVNRRPDEFHKQHNKARYSYKQVLTARIQTEREISLRARRSPWRMAFPNLLKTLLAISAIFFLRLQMSSCKTTRTKTLILGAGPAGVGFGSTLHKNGNKDFLILEANSYVGGRLRDVKLGNLTIQPGAGWIHDIGSHNPFSALKTKFGLKVMADDQTDTIVRFCSCFLLSGFLVAFKFL